MTHRERMLSTLRCQPTDRLPVDIMEGFFFGGMRQFFSQKGFATKEQALQWLDIDCRWLYCFDHPRDQIARYDEEFLDEKDICIDNEYATYSGAYQRPLRDCTTASEVERLYHPDTSHLLPPDSGAARQRWPDHALILLPDWMPLFCGACDLFGMEAALMSFHTAPQAIQAFIELRNHAYCEMLERVLRECQDIDIVWLGDDYAAERSLMMSPAMWRTFIRPYLRKQVDIVHKYGKMVLFHSCGAVSELYPDWIDMGIDAHLVFQTTAANMDAQRISREFGGKLAFYGGIDVQHLLVNGTPDMVRSEVRKNAAAFAHCGGYIVANSHHGLPDIRPDLIEIMAMAARGE